MSKIVNYHHTRCYGRQARPGIVLVSTLIITVLASMIAASLLFRIHAEVAAAGASTRGHQAYDAAMSGLHTAMSMLLGQPEGGTLESQQIIAERLGDRTLWYDNPDMLRNQFVADDGADRWYFTVYAYHDNVRDQVRYGLTDESGKINLNIAPREVILQLPGMTPELVDALIDYRDRDSEPGEFGAEQEYYDQLPLPYLIKNGPFGTLEELLLVRGFNGSVLYGEDANLNGLLEPNEDDGDERFPTDDNDGQLNRGLVGMATVASYGPDVDSTGESRIELNRASEGQLRDVGLSSQAVDFITSYREDDQVFTHPSQLLGMSHRIRGSRGEGGGRGRSRGGPRAGQIIESGVGAEDLPVIMDRFTTVPGRGRLPWFGLVNVNTASVDALAALPELERGIAESIVSSRANLEPDEQASTAWIYTRGLVDTDTYRAVAPMLTPRGYQFRVRCIGFGVPCGRYRIIEAVIDLAAPTPGITYLRDLTRLGPPFPLTPDTEEAAG